MLHLCMTRKDRLQQRNAKVKEQYTALTKKHPQWRYQAIIKELAKEVYLAPRTIEAILRGEGIYQ